MDKRIQYDTSKILRIENLSKLLKDTNATLENKYFVINEIITEYEKYSFDSTLIYIEKSIEIAKALNKPIYDKKSKLKLSKLLVQSGRYKEAIDVLNNLNRAQLDGGILNLYYYIFKEGYSGLSFYTSVKKNKEKYTFLYKAYQDSLAHRLHANSGEFLALVEKKHRDAYRIKEALSINSKRLKQAAMGTPEYSLTTFERALLYQLSGDSHTQKWFLTLSAISDIKASVKDNASLTELAMLLFKEKNISKAHKYIAFSVDDAELYNSKLRFVNISNKLSVISKAYEAKNLEQKSKLQNMLFFISILVLVLILTICYIYQQIKKLSAARKSLKQANLQLKDLNSKLKFTNEDLNRLYNELSNSDKIKEQYVGMFLNLYSDYINKLDTYRKMVRKYIVANKTNALLDLTKSKQLIGNELNIFYQNFDKSFLHIYPNFVEDFNTLLKEEHRIVLKEKQTLNTELRIFALIRLGITNSSKISKILRYSVNTIYNYRVKVKNGAIDRNTFETTVKNIS
jgi:uncharacterized membrane protein YciS (DUF1049 family)